MGGSREQTIEQLNRRALWEGHLGCWQKSGQTATAYCKEQQLSIDRFKYWQHRIIPHTKRSRGSKGFVEVSLTEPKRHAVTEASASASIVLETPLGYKIHLPRDVSQGELSLFLCSLRQSSC